MYEYSNSGTILTDFSHHFTNCIAIPTRQANSATEFRFTRDFSTKKVQNFKETLGNLGWQNVLYSDDVKESFGFF